MEFQQEQEQDSKEEEMMDVYSIFIYGIRSQLTCDYYLRRLKRRIHNKMEQLALQQPFNFDIVFGFTDSIFVKVKEGDDYMIKGFIEKCKQELGVIVEIKNVFLKSIVYGKKNRFVGWSGKEEEDIVIKRAWTALQIQILCG